MVLPAHDHITIVPQRLFEAFSTVAGYLDAHVSRRRNNAQIKSAREGEATVFENHVQKRLKADGRGLK